MEYITLATVLTSLGTSGLLAFKYIMPAYDDYHRAKCREDHGDDENKAYNKCKLCGVFIAFTSVFVFTAGISSILSIISKTLIGV